LIRLRIVLILLAGAGCSALASDEPEPPDAALLEFLGSWEGEDDTWQAFFDSLPAIDDQVSSDEEQDDRRKTGEPD